MTRELRRISLVWLPDCIEAGRAVLPHSPLGLLRPGIARVMINAWKYGS
ncbi:hypothetical protein RBSWK_04816 [Rhodopirellula baltica SWK14]|uniref:Uncharacterized protein n=1 Tax=Rhodopirellula baltica SWK14 TaxID=993516 RepID=L7CE34_RHOBT|nr:hypothetical protein RBSWK_04816 [Rhodopirellula baltica SWK14]